METREAFKKVYDLWVDRTGGRVPAIERHVGIPRAVSVSIDDRRNEAVFYRELAHDDGQFLGSCLKSFLADLRVSSFEESDDVIDAIAFLQWTVADLLWRYRIQLSEELEAFAREYDRLDVPEERRRLYEIVQSSTPVE